MNYWHCDECYHSEPFTSFTPLFRCPKCGSMEWLPLERNDPMSKRYILSDDIDNTQDDTVETVTWSFGGKMLEIDLTDTNREAFAKAVSQFTEHSREITRLVFVSRLGNETNAEGDIRSWAKSHGYEVGDRGRIPQEVKDAYHKDKETKSESAEVHSGSEGSGGPAPASNSSSETPAPAIPAAAFSDKPAKASK